MTQTAETSKTSLPTSMDEVQGREFNPFDVCDAERSGKTSAYVVVEHDDFGELALCKHHFEKHELVLVSGGWRVHDFRDRINEQAMSASKVDD